MGISVSQGTEGERQYLALGYCVCDCGAACWCSGGLGVVVGKGVEGQGEEREDWDEGWEWRRRGEEGALRYPRSGPWLGGLSSGMLYHILLFGLWYICTFFGVGDGKNVSHLVDAGSIMAIL